MITVEKAEPYHFPAIAQLNVTAYREYATHLTMPAWITMQTNLSAIPTTAQRAEFLIVQIGGELVGSVAYCPPGQSVDPIPQAWASILLLAVAPAHRSQGIAQALIKQCIQQAQKDAALTIGLFTSEIMTLARQLYQSFGFREDGEIPQRLGLRYWRYRLDLAPTETLV